MRMTSVNCGLSPIGELTEMSMEIYVFSDRQLSSIANWQTAIDNQGFALTLSTARPFAAIRHLLPIQVAGAQTGFECDHWDSSDILDGYPEIGFDHRWKYCLAFRWGADFKACLGAYMAAAAYAGATDGVVFDCEQAQLLSPQEAVQAARDIERQLPAMEQALRGAIEKLKTRP